MPAELKETPEDYGLQTQQKNRSEVVDRLNKAYNDPSSIVGQGNIPGSNIHELSMPGITGTGSQIRFIEKSGQIITIIVK